MLGAKPLSEKVSRGAFLMYILFLQLASAHHLLVEPGISSEWKIFNTSYAMYLAVLGSMIHGMTVPGAIEAAQRARGFTQGPLRAGFEKPPGTTRRSAAMFLSLITFGFLGGISGVVHRHRADQPDHAQHASTYRVTSTPRSYAGTTLAFMAASPIWSSR